MSENKTKPGVIVYFDDIRPALNRLSDEQCGRLLRAMVDYAQYGITSELDSMTGMAFDMLMPKIDRDAVKYAEACEQRQYAVYVRESKKHGVVPVSIAEWRLSRQMSADIEPMRADNGAYPIAKKTISATSYASAPTSTSAMTSISGEEAAEGCKGEEEGEPEQLYAALCQAMDAHDNKRALNLSSHLFRLGYNFNPSTRILTKR